MTPTKKPLAHLRDLRVLVRRDPDGKVFSEVRDLKAEPDPRRYVGSAIVIDRQGRGTAGSEDGVLSRAQTLATLLGLPLDVDLVQQCRLDLGWAGICNCERCVEKRDARAKR